MEIDSKDLDYRLIATAFDKQREVSSGWAELERIYNNVIDSELLQALDKSGRSDIFVPIARDTILIKRSIFSSSFLINQFALNISRVGEEDSEIARQLRIACRYYWEKSDPFIEINKAMLRMLILPIGVTTLKYDIKKDDYIINEKNPMDVAFDPDAENQNDVQYMAHKYYKSAKEIKSILDNDRKKKKEFKFYNKLNGFIDYFDQSFDADYFDAFRRYEFEEILIKEDNGWKVKTYSNSKLCREFLFLENPFAWGFVREKLSSVDKNLRDKQVLVYGESEIDLIKDHVKTINIRRNQHSDIVEKQINPDVFVGGNAKINVKDLNSGGGKKIPCGDVNAIKERTAPTTMGLQTDISMYVDDINKTSAINDNQRGVTSTSDRRATGAIALLNSQSSSRLEEQITTANNTLFSHLVKNFAKKVWRNVSSKTLKSLGIQDPKIGREFYKKGDAFDFVVKVDFGSDNKRAERYAALMEMIQAAGQFQNSNPTRIDQMFAEAASIKLGDESNLAKDLLVSQEVIPEQVEKPAFAGGAI